MNRKILATSVVALLGLSAIANAQTPAAAPTETEPAPSADSQAQGTTENPIPCLPPATTPPQGSKAASTPGVQIGTVHIDSVTNLQIEVAQPQGEDETAASAPSEPTPAETLVDDAVQEPPKKTTFASLLGLPEGTELRPYLSLDLSAVSWSGMKGIPARFNSGSDRPSYWGLYGSWQPNPEFAFIAVLESGIGDSGVFGFANSNDGTRPADKLGLFNRQLYLAAHFKGKAPLAYPLIGVRASQRTRSSADGKNQDQIAPIGLAGFNPLNGMVPFQTAEFGPLAGTNWLFSDRVIELNFNSDADNPGKEFAVRFTGMFGPGIGNSSVVGGIHLDFIKPMPAIGPFWSSLGWQATKTPKGVIWLFNATVSQRLKLSSTSDADELTFMVGATRLYRPDPGVLDLPESVAPRENEDEPERPHLTGYSSYVGASYDFMTYDTVKSEKAKWGTFSSAVTRMSLNRTSRDAWGLQERFVKYWGDMLSTNVSFFYYNNQRDQFGREATYRPQHVQFTEPGVDGNASPAVGYGFMTGVTFRLWVPK